MITKTLNKQRYARREEITHLKKGEAKKDGFVTKVSCLPMQETQETQVQSLGQEDPLE